MSNVDVTEYKLGDKITALKTMCADFKRSVTGWVQTGKGTIWEYTGEALVGERAASTLTSILLPFTYEINLISMKSDYRMATQLYDNTMASLGSMLLDIGVPGRNYNMICVTFIDYLENIFDIIGSSKNMFENMFNKAEEEKEINQI